MFRPVEFASEGAMLRGRLHYFAHQWYQRRWSNRVTTLQASFLARRLVAAVLA
jgi:hypothetical protein